MLRSIPYQALALRVPRRLRTSPRSMSTSRPRNRKDLESRCETLKTPFTEESDHTPPPPPAAAWKTVVGVMTFGLGAWFVIRSLQFDRTTGNPDAST
ncbi:hypothetical protein H4R34_000897 [Dimargaris verticillata]|uniref:Uncharacterized protein n=1 Tax=Dimargaris verticillata TaxID=2761393 RepID=A0A9W8EFI1_9FUNG|nr:hypothetical protein H4R34_000897 [Dimargaris verticillata]